MNELVVNERVGVREDRPRDSSRQNGPAERPTYPPSLDNWTNDKSTSVKVLTPLKPVQEKFIFNGWE